MKPSSPHTQTNQDQAEAQPAAAPPPKPSKPPSKTLTIAVFFLVAILLALHLYLDDPPTFLFFDHHLPTQPVQVSWTTPDINTPTLEYKLIPPSNNSTEATWTFLLLHGLGDYHASDSFRLKDALVQLNPVLFQSTQFIIPSAGILPISVFDNQLRSAWFDIKNWTNVHQQEDISNMKQNVRALRRIIHDNQLDLNRTIIGGFSQGAVMSLLLSLTLETPPAGVIMLSGYSPIPEEMKQIPLTTRTTTSEWNWIQMKRKKNQEWRTRLHWLHGEIDPFFPIEFAKEGYNSLKEWDYFSKSSLKFDSLKGLDHRWSIPELNILIDSSLLSIFSSSSSSSSF